MNKNTDNLAKPKSEVIRVQIFDKTYDYNTLTDESKKLFVLQDDIRRDLAFHHARADAALLHIRSQLEKTVKNEKPLEE